MLIHCVYAIVLISGSGSLYYSYQHINYLWQKPKIDTIYATLKKDMPEKPSSDGMPEKYALNFYVNKYFGISKKYPIPRDQLISMSDKIYGGNFMVLHPNHETYQKLVNDYEKNYLNNTSFKKGAGCALIAVASAAGIYYFSNKKR